MIKGTGRWLQEFLPSRSLAYRATHGPQKGACCDYNKIATISDYVCYLRKLVLSINLTHLRELKAVLFTGF